MVSEEYKDYFTDLYETGSLSVAVCNAEANRVQLSDMPHEQREDLALYYGVRVPTMVNKNGIIAIHNSQLEKWGISSEQLKKDAWENMEKEYPAVFRTIDDVICGIQDSIAPGLEGTGMEECVGNDVMFVLSNRDNVQGAVYIFDEKIMEKIAEKLDSSLVILPSSIHEAIIIRETEDMDMEFMRGMVREVNEISVTPEERLSDEVYHYDRETGILSMARFLQHEEDMLGVEEMHDQDCAGQSEGMVPCMMQ